MDKANVSEARISVSLPRQTYDEVGQLALRQSRSRASVVRLAIELYLTQEDAYRPRA